MSIDIRNVSKNFGSFAALKDVSLEIRGGELLALLGPSGSGKTTLLRIIAGLENPDQGHILFHGEDTTNRTARDRRVGFVFQHYALFRHMSVMENVAFGLRVRPRKERPSNKDIQARVLELLRLVQLEGLAGRYPHQLSGGQRQRVALARALAVEPKVLLLDEPFGALDAKVRVELRRWLRRFHDDLGITSIFVTHDQEEALEVSDRVVVMNQGRIEQVGTPDEVYEAPANPFVYHFLGNVNLFHGRANDGSFSYGSLDAEAPEHVGAKDAPAVGYVRPHDLEVLKHKNGGISIPAIIKHVHPVGPIVRLELQRDDNQELIEAHLTRERFRELELTAGETVHVKPKQLRVFTDDYSI
jgi:sulfate/thiosulfate transport system ATP-binding protein